MSSRSIEFRRATGETEISVTLDLDGTGESRIETGLGFFDHMLTALAKHARWNLTLTCRGDLHVDDHHTVEDCALTLGQALNRILGERSGIERFGSAYAPLDEALARVVVDLSGRPAPVVDLRLERERIGTVAAENLVHFFVSFAHAGLMSLHVDVIRGANDHHRAESAFKACALALRQATRRTGELSIPSTKGVLSV